MKLAQITQTLTTGYLILRVKIKEVIRLVRGVITTALIKIAYSEESGPVWAIVPVGHLILLSNKNRKI